MKSSKTFLSQYRMGEVNPLDKYKLILKIGQGSYGTIWKTINTEKNKTVALKSIKIPNETVKKLMDKEVEFLITLSKPNCNNFLTCYYDSFYVDNVLYIEMEYIDGKTLKEFAKYYRDSEDLTSLYKYLAALSEDILKGLDYLHKKGIIHRDIKPENIMIDKNNVPKIIDIGLGCYANELCKFRNNGMLNEKQCCVGTAGSPYFMSPEVLLQNKSYYVSDIWSLGASLYKEAKNGYPFDARNLRSLKNNIKNNSSPKLQTSNVQLNTIVNSMLNKSFILRPTAAKLIDTLYVQNTYVISDKDKQTLFKY